MKIAQLTPGSGDNFYCENCLRDAAVVKAVRKNGHDMIIIPMYLPLQSESDDKLANAPIFYGGINVYLQQKLRLFRNTPRWLDKLLDSEWLLGRVAKKASMTAAKDLAETTISMLNGEHGRQVKELERLVEWLARDEHKPDVVCLSNLLLAGMAKQIKRVVKVPVVSLMQDEDGFLDGLGEQWADKAWEILKQRCEDIDAFLSPSKYYAGLMKDRLGLADEKVHVVRMGIDVGKYASMPKESDVPVIGFLSRMCKEKGLDVLVDAYIILKKKQGLEKLRLRISGGKSQTDNEFIGEQTSKLHAEGFADDVEFLDEFDADSRHKFFEGLRILSVPARQEAAYGLFAIEAMAAGVPAVQPDIGVFKELIEQSAGGAVYEPNTAQELAGVLEPLLRDDEIRKKYSENAKKAAMELFNVEKTAVELVRLFEVIVGK